MGFEIFDDIKIGQTDFVQRINYQRALQGELARTISEFPQVERARVHLVIPQKSLFMEEQIPPSASVVLKLKEGQKLENKQVTGIVNLVTMSVEGLETNRITVTDMKGKVLYQPDEDDSGFSGLSSAQLDYKSSMERKMEQRIQEMLMPVVGPQKIIARVNTDLDFSQRTIKKELYDPEVTVVRSEQRSEEQTKGRANLEGGVPEANFRGDGFAGSLSTQDSNRETRTTNYEINKEEMQVITPTGAIDRITVAVIVDGTYTVDEKTGEAVYVPRSQEELTRITQLVKNTVGFDEARGGRHRGFQHLLWRAGPDGRGRPAPDHDGVHAAAGQALPERPFDLPLPDPGGPARGHGPDPAARGRAGDRGAGRSARGGRTPGLDRRGA